MSKDPNKLSAAGTSLVILQSAPSLTKFCMLIRQQVDLVSPVRRVPELYAVVVRQRGQKQ